MLIFSSEEEAMKGVTGIPERGKLEEIFNIENKYTCHFTAVYSRPEEWMWGSEKDTEEEIKLQLTELVEDRAETGRGTDRESESDYSYVSCKGST